MLLAMNTPVRKLISRIILLVLVTSATFALPTVPPSKPLAGFYMPDSVREVTLRFRNVKNLIVVPVTINDTLQVNLILDTGCRNLVLFGKRFQKLFPLEQNRKVQFSGLGSGKPVVGSLSLGNRVSIDAVLGENIPVVIVPNQNLFGAYTNVHGVIGYDIFVKFEVELNLAKKSITFRPAATSDLPNDFVRVPIRIEDSRPLIDCRVVFTNNNSHICDLMIDTGSSLGLLLKTTDIRNYDFDGKKSIIGRGFNGLIEGIEMTTEKLILSEFEIKSVQTGIIHSPWHNHASIGMDVMKDYALVLNYCKGYAGFRKA